MSRRPFLPAAALAASIALAVAPAARAACSYNIMTTDVGQVASASPTYFEFTTANTYWSAVGAICMPGAPNEDWSVTVNSSTAGSPTCVAGPLASSDGGGGKVNYVIGDFNHNTLGTYYPSVVHTAGSYSTYVQWSGDSNALTVNAAAVTGTLWPNDVLRVWDVYLVSGTTYSFVYYGGGNVQLFGNALGGTYWAGRSAALVDTPNSFTFTATFTGWYGVVVTNDSGYGSLYTLAVTSNGCGAPPLLGSSSAIASIAASAPNQTVAAGFFAWGWTGFATRGNGGTDWDLTLYGLPTGGSPPNCLTQSLSSSTSGGGLVDVAVADCDPGASPNGWYFANAYPFSGTSGRVGYMGSGAIQVNFAPTTGSFATTDLAKMYTVELLSGHTYQLGFSAPAGMTLLLFANPAGTAYYTGRAGAVLSTTANTTYTPSVSGNYGVAVVNDGSVAGSYSISFGDCSLVTSLTAGVTSNTWYATNTYWAFEQNFDFWTAVGVNGPNNDWDIFVDADSASTWPNCTSSVLASSVYSPPKQDFVVGDFNHNAPGRYYSRVHLFNAATADTGAVEWTALNPILVPNDNNATTRFTGPQDWLQCWDVYLVAGQQYEFAIAHGGGADLKVAVFRNGAGGTYWAGRSAEEFETTTSQAYTAVTSGYYGVVVVNDNLGSDVYTLSVATCNPIIALPAGPAYTITNDPVAYTSFAENSAFWTPVAVRAVGTGEDYDLGVFGSGTGGGIGTCFSNQLGASYAGAGTTDFVVGDFNYNPFGTYYARGDRFAGVYGAEMQYWPGNQVLFANAALTVVSAGPTFLVESWDANLIAGQTYTVFFSHDPGLDAKVDVFKPTGGVQWASRASAMLEGQYSVSFTAPVSGWYGVVVVNDGGQGYFNVALRTGNVGVDDGATRPVADVLGGISPNPARGELHVDFALRDGGEPSFEVIDLAGRRVASLTTGGRSAGQWSIAWHPQDETGKPLAPGVYFLRMRLGERIVGTRRCTLLQ